MAAKRGPKPKPEAGRLKNAVAMRGTEAWTAWLNGWAADLGMPATVLIDQALREKAKRDGREAPPSRTQEGR